MHVVDLTNVASNDSANHSKFATGEVVAAIGARLAEGQALSDGKPGLVESLGAFTGGAIGTAASVATGAITAPTRLVDPTLQREVRRHRRGFRHAQVTRSGWG